jgi:hypothetical protein
MTIAGQEGEMEKVDGIQVSIKVDCGYVAFIGY